MAWRGTMMAHSAVDPYWLAGVRREITDHPEHAVAIEDECSKCHKPMQRYANQLMGNVGHVFVGNPAGPNDIPADAPMSVDGVSCGVCHQIDAANLGTPESLVGGFELDKVAPVGTRRVYGPHTIATGTKRVMSSATRFEPNRADHMQRPELCATCHTLFTHAIGEDGQPTEPFPEQVPYLEWQHSDYGDAQSCQSCHLAEVRQPHPISSVVGKPREQLSQHSFRGGNFVVPQLLAAGVGDARVGAQELELVVRKTKAHLRDAAAIVTIDADGAVVKDGELRVEVNIANLAGHKLPTAYPSRRVWLQVTMISATGKKLFESGALEPNGAIAGNDNDTDAARFEPHYDVVSQPDQVQIYESVMGNYAGEVTTGLLRATQYLKDNRLLPVGFDKNAAPADVAVKGQAVTDSGFTDGGDGVEYVIAVQPSDLPVSIEVRLWYQAIGYRWAQNLAGYDAPEPQAFVQGYNQLSGTDTAVMLAEEQVVITDPAPAP
ncbi:hypothetical protein ACFL6C_02860 [Myxococcota bacterium]